MNDGGIMLIVWLVCAALAGWIGSTKGRTVAGIVLGLLFGFIGVFVILFVPARSAESRR